MQQTPLPVFSAALAGVVFGGLLVSASMMLTDPHGELDASAGTVSATPVQLQPAGAMTLPRDPAGAGDAVAATADDAARRIDELDQRLASLAGSLAWTRDLIERQRQLDAIQGTDDEALADVHDIEAARTYELELWEERKLALEAESEDRHWAGPARATLESEAGVVADGVGAAVVDTTCRSTLCSIVVEWPDYGSAVAGYTDFLHHDYRLACARETLLPEPDPADIDAPYRMTMVFDCGAGGDPG